MVNVKEPKAKATRWTRTLGFTFPVLLDGDGRVATAYAPAGVLPDLPRDQIPIASNLILDRAGAIQFYSLLDSANFDARLVALTARLDELLAAEAGVPAPPAAIVAVQGGAPVTVAAGAPAEGRIAVTVADGYKIQANPASDQFLIPAQLELKAGGGLRPGAPIYPPGQPHRLEGTSADLLTYQGTFEIVVPLQAAASARPGRHRLRGVLRYQACDSRSCLFPAAVPVTLSAEVR